MAKIPFDIKYRPQIESGEYIVIDRFNYKLHFVKEEDGVFFFTVRYPGCNYDTERLYDHPERHLFITAPELELNEFEKGVKSTMIRATHYEDDYVRQEAKELLSLARDQLIKEGYVIEKKAFHDAVEKVSPEVTKDVSDNVDMKEALRLEYEKGRADVLKDLPRWKKVGLDTGQTTLVVGYTNEEDKLYRNGYVISLTDLEKLPKED